MPKTVSALCFSDEGNSDIFVDDTEGILHSFVDRWIQKAGVGKPGFEKTVDRLEKKEPKITSIVDP